MGDISISSQLRIRDYPRRDFYKNEKELICSTSPASLVNDKIEGTLS